MNFTLLLISRVKSDNPAFFKKLQAIAMILLVIDAIVYGVLYLNTLPIDPVLVQKLTTTTLTVGTFLCGIVFTSQTGTKDPELISKDTKNNIIEQVGNKE